MKNMKKSVSVLLCVVLLCLMLCACGDNAKSDVPVADIAAKVTEAIGKTDSLTQVDANYIKGFMKIDASQFGEYAMLINAYGANIDEFGVFKAGEDMSADEIEAAVESYLQLRKDSWMEEYMPEEKPKLTSAEIKVAGDYVMYCILSDADKSAAFGAFEDCLN